VSWIFFELSADSISRFNLADVFFINIGIVCLLIASFKTTSFRPQGSTRQEGNGGREDALSLDSCIPLLSYI